MKDFSKKTLAQLDKKGIKIVGSQAIPAFPGDKYFSGVSYSLSVNSRGFIRTHSQVVILAQSSWNPETDLQD